MHEVAGKYLELLCDLVPSNCFDPIERGSVKKRSRKEYYKMTDTLTMRLDMRLTLLVTVNGQFRYVKFNFRNAELSMKSDFPY